MVNVRVMVKKCEKHDKVKRVQQSHIPATSSSVEQSSKNEGLARNRTGVAGRH
jgi:hypothetical protein